MITNVYTIYDRKALIYNVPFCAVSDGAALRSFSDLANDGNTSIGRHPGDYVLYRCGQFDDSNGQLLPVPALLHVGDALALVTKQDAFSFDRPHRSDANGAANDQQP